MKQGADWLAWSLQFIAGFIVGAILALGGMRRSWRVGSNIGSQHLLMITAGAALVGAGLASYFGDRLWIGSSYRVIPPDDIPHSTTSKALSIFTGAVGGALIVLVLLLNLQII